MNNLKTSKKNEFFSYIKNYVSSECYELMIISPYIKVKVLEKLLDNVKAKKITVITTWKLRDMQFGSSDIELYKFCEKEGINLHLNQKIHLKVIIRDCDSCIMGSANISNNGLALVDNHNYELINKIDKLDDSSISYFKKILDEAILVTEEIYEQFKEDLKNLPKLEKIKEPIIKNPKKDFLISTLPMSYSIDDFFKIYSNNFKGSSRERIACAIHDAELYNVPENLSENEFVSHLKRKFFKSPFVSELLKFINEEERYFGRVKKWIQDNCTNVPIPSRRNLTGNIQVLYKWIEKLSDGLYEVDIPGKHSQRIRRVK